MSLHRELKIQTLVLLAKRPSSFNPSEFNQYWLDVNKVISAKSLHKQSSFAPNFVQAITESVNLVVTKDQIQIAPSSPETFRDIITKNSVALIRNMEDVPFKGMGLNFNWYLWDDEVDYGNLAKKYFYNTDNPASKYFSEEDCMFGNYMSKDLTQGVRMKLDIKPIILNDLKENKELRLIQLAFNFHSDLMFENQKDQICDIISNYDTWFNLSEEIVNTFN